MIRTRFLFRELSHGRAQALTFMLCVALSIATLTALNSFRTDVRQTLLSDAQALHGGDVIIHSHYPISPQLAAAVESMRSSGAATVTETYSFYTVVRAAGDSGGRTLFVNVVVIGADYPLYGRVELQSGRQFADVVGPGTVAVAGEVLQRLSVAVGDRLRLGKLDLLVGDAVVFDPTRPVSVFTLGPRIFVSADDLDAMGVLGTGSRSSHELLIRLADPAQAEAVAEQLDTLSAVGQEQVTTAESARSPVKRFFDNLLFFLSFISIFTLLLSGIGMQSALGALLRQKQATIAVARTVGATRRFLLANYLGLALLLGATGSLLGVVAGLSIKRVFPVLLGSIIPPGMQFGVAPGDVGEGLLVGILVVVLFSLLPLYRAEAIKPVALLRHDTAETRGRGVTLLLALLVVIFLSMLVIRQLADVRIGLIFMAVCLVFIALIVLLVTVLLWAVRRVPIRWLALRQAQKSLFRPGNATRPVIVTLTSAFAVLTMIFLLQKNLVGSFIESFPDDAPNLFCIDIQPDQRQPFLDVVGRDVPLFPVVRGRLLKINGNPIDYEREQQRKSDTLAREFNLTYRQVLLDDEVIVDGGPLFSAARNAGVRVEVSVLDTIADIGGIEVGDRLLFSIQGLPLEAEVTTIRSRTRSKLFPFFYFVFPPEVLAAAPHTFFAAFHVAADKLDGITSGIVADFPNVSIINVAETAARLSLLAKRLAVTVTFFAAFAIIAGMLILVGSIMATRLERIRDGVFFKIVGANGLFVLEVIILENLAIGLMSSVVAVLAGLCGAWFLCHRYFEIPFQMPLLFLLLVVPLSCVLVAGVGLAGSWSIIREKPMSFLARYR